MKKIKRILLKVSGESLQNTKTNTILDLNKLNNLAKLVKELIKKHDVEVSLVVGAGNIYRGKTAKELDLNHTTADQMGMTATTINALAIQNALDKQGIKNHILSGFKVGNFVEEYQFRLANKYLDKKEVVIFSGGTGSPYFSTDTCAAIRALEINADAILMGKNGVDGVYDSDPRINKNAKKITKITYQDILDKKLSFMDLTATTIIMTNTETLNVYVFSMDDLNNVIKIIEGKNIGTIVSKK